MLYVKPRDGRTSSAVAYPADVTALDISAYHGDVEILGLPPSAVVRNPDRHVRVNAAWKDQAADWHIAGIGRLGFFAICVRKVRLGGYECGYFGLSTKRSKYYDEAMSQMKILSERFGLTFD
jgi:hypothetical protein